MYQIYYEIRKNVDETTIWDISKIVINYLDGHHSVNVSNSEITADIELREKRHIILTHPNVSAFHIGRTTYSKQKDPNANLLPVQIL